MSKDIPPMQGRIERLLGYLFPGWALRRARARAGLQAVRERSARASGPGEHRERPTITATWKPGRGFEFEGEG